MSTTKRLGAILAACLLLVAAATPLASAQPVPPEPEIMLTIEGPAYAPRGGEAALTFTLKNVGLVPVNTIEWESDACPLPPPSNRFTLFPGDELVEKCKYKTPPDGPLWKVTAKAAASGSEPPFTRVDTGTSLEMYSATFVKEVVRYWSNNTLKVVDSSLDDRVFRLLLKRNGADVGIEPFSVKDRLELWVTEGKWYYGETGPFPGGIHLLSSGEFQMPGAAPVERTLVNLAHYDLKVEKDGPVWAYRGAAITYTYKVTNAGPAAVPLKINDTRCSAIRLVSGDDGDGLVERGETWTLRCTYTPTWDPRLLPIENTVTVSDAGYPKGWTPRHGGDSDTRNNTDSYALYPLVLEKDMFLYYGPLAADKVPINGFERTEFKVAMSRRGNHVAHVRISEAAPAYLWLSEGEWKFVERDVPTGFASAAPAGFTINTEMYEPKLIYPNVALFDLKVEKTGPVWAYEGDVVIWTYEVTNAGPASVTPDISDNKCGSIAYIEGDKDKDGKVDPGETWIYKCRRVPTWDGKTPFTNTVTVTDKEGARIDPRFGGDVNLRNNTDSFTLYPFTLEKAMFLYFGRAPDQVPIKGFEKVQFGVAMSRNGTHVANLVLSKAKPIKVWLSEGPWKFVERRIPAGFQSADPDGIMFNTKDYDHTYAYPNTVDFDLKVEKKLWWGKLVPGKIIAYKYKVTNDGPASVAPKISDNKCSPVVFKWGDKNGNKLVDPGETWVYRCKYKIPHGVHEVTNTVTVRDVEGHGLNPPFGGDVNLKNNTATLTLKIGWHGCAYYKWKQPKHFDEWPTGYDPDMPVGPVFGLWAKLDLNRDGTPDTMLDALHYKSSRGIKGAKKMLLKQGVTALLNEAEFGVHYPPYDSVGELKKEVKRTFKSGKKWKMQKLTKQLKHWNMGYCPL